MLKILEQIPFIGHYIDNALVGAHWAVKGALFLLLGSPL